MIEKLDMNYPEYANPNDIRAAVINLSRKLNEVIDWINDEPKRKLSEARPNPLLNDIKPTDPFASFDPYYGVFRAGGIKELEPKWKVGDKFWYIETSICDEGHVSNYYKEWTVREGQVYRHNLYKIEKEPNIFKTKAQAEAALAEIKQVMEKYK